MLLSLGSRENLGTSLKGSEEAVNGSHTSLGEALCADQAQRRSFDTLWEGKRTGAAASPRKECPYGREKSGWM